MITDQEDQALRLAREVLRCNLVLLCFGHKEELKYEEAWMTQSEANIHLAFAPGTPELIMWQETP